MSTPNPNRPSCLKCKSGNVRVNKDGTIVCLRCGYRETPKVSS